MFKSNTRSIISPYELDIWIPSHNLAIEFNGRYYHSLDGTELPTVKYKHRDKFICCRKKEIKLLQIDEHEWNDPVVREIWKSVIASKLGKHERLYARQTIFRSVTREEAEKFLASNHLQGQTPSARNEWCFGLFHGEQMVGVMTFSRHQKTLINLTRMAFLCGLSVTGGASKLFKNALNVLPPLTVVTFSNNRYSNGGVYERLGFAREKVLQPSYQWYWHGKIWNKRQLRKIKLAVLLSDYDPRQTEHQNLYRHGARCLYDAGYERWAYPQRPQDNGKDYAYKGSLSLPEENTAFNRQKSPIEPKAFRKNLP